MNLDLSEKEIAAAAALAKEKGMSEAAVMRQALRLYQMVHDRLKAGETFSFSGDAARAAEFVGREPEPEPQNDSWFRPRHIG